ncbi:aminotransferase class I/II-fold pyridoxal phosphate-dependent enzyme [Solwaraspora sp. WMMD406]|uniref:aminotransferase class I/II-fold pyridoxal phosphate-dependent enzyme n=1 Tax=Solwaraspora sp. WMMD406 TaxID=3016095 RepID=UPI002417F04F|nr:aminotransferase class I/II-fold pyridoxal phosphate-dependent enzyme [Solwaraspora sp. WMMD406]MDG4767077.1 aminotransferase class I/II-fold pyridoxal phosphate-dependent enzyme [Solwaraspora sp. WMMD406]
MVEHYQPVGSTATEICASVETGVRTGALAPGAALPPVRVLAATLAVSPATVAKAYQVLRQRGIVHTDGRRGTRIRPRTPVAELGPRSDPMPPPAPDGLLDLATGEPDPRLLPSIPTHLASLAHTLDADGYTPGYADAGPLPALTELARERFAATGLLPAPVTVTSGALDGIERLLRGQLRPGDRVAVEDPGWANLLDLVAALGLTAVPMPVDDHGPTESGLRRALAAGARAVVVTTRAQNPTGAAVSAPRADALRGLLRASPDVLLVEDDHAAELSDAPARPLAGATTHWAFVRSVSKPYGPDLRVALLTGDEATVSRIEGRMRIGSGWVSTLLQHLVVRLWRDPTVAATVTSAADSYRRRRTALRAALGEHGVASHGGSGINVWVPVTDETWAVGQLQAEGYLVAPGSRYRLDSAAGVRITISRLDDDAMAALAQAVHRAVRPPSRRPIGR